MLSGTTFLHHPPNTILFLSSDKERLHSIIIRYKKRRRELNNSRTENYQQEEFLVWITLQTRKIGDIHILHKVAKGAVLTNSVLALNKPLVKLAPRRFPLQAWPLSLDPHTRPTTRKWQRMVTASVTTVSK